MNDRPPSAPRWLGAVLCLFASFAFALRDTAAVDAAAIHPGALAVHAAHPACDSPMPGMGQPSAPRQAHDHGGHCPFCFAGGFALEALEVAPVGVLLGRVPHGSPARVSVHAAPIRHADARAPPHFIA